MTTQNGSFLATRRGRLTLLLLCAVQFLDVADSSIMNVALPSIRRDLGFSVQNLQRILLGYLVTYGGLLLLGGPAGDLLGRWRLLSAGISLFAACSLAGGLAMSAGWRWVLFVNLLVCALILAGGAHLLPAERHRARPANFDIPGAMVTAGMLLLVYALVRALQQGWANVRTIGELATAGLLLAAFAVTEPRRRGPLFPFSIFHTGGWRPPTPPR